MKECQVKVEMMGGRSLTLLVVPSDHTTPHQYLPATDIRIQVTMIFVEHSRRFWLAIFSSHVFNGIALCQLEVDHVYASRMYVLEPGDHFCYQDHFASRAGPAEMDCQKS